MLVSVSLELPLREISRPISSSVQRRDVEVSDSGDAGSMFTGDGCPSGFQCDVLSTAGRIPPAQPSSRTKPQQKRKPAGVSTVVDAPTLSLPHPAAFNFVGARVIGGKERVGALERGPRQIA